MYWFLSLAHKEVKRVFRIWKQTLVPSVITWILYFLVFGKFIWSKITDVDWVWYMEFIVPGFIMMSIIVQSYTNVSSSFFSAKFTSSIEEILVSPIKDYFVLIAFVLWWIVRWMVVWGLILAVSIFFVDVKIEHIWLWLLFSFLTATLFGLLWLFNGFFAKSFDDVAIIPTFVITPLTYLWWVFYSLSFLPDFWQKVSLFNPIFYMVNWLRYSFFWETQVWIWYALFYIILWIIALFLVILTMFRKWYWLKS